jgi:hypothetical protein
MAGGISCGLNQSFISRWASSLDAEAWIRLSMRSPITFPLESLSGTSVPSARMQPGIFSRATKGFVGPARSRIFLTASGPWYTNAITRRVPGVSAQSGYIFDEGGKKNLSPMFSVMLLGKHTVHMDYFRGGETQAGMEFGELG